MAVAPVPWIAALSRVAARAAATTGAHPIATAAAPAAELVAHVVAAAAGLTDREVGGPPLFLVALDARQRRADQLAVHGTILDVRPALIVILVELVVA